MTTHNAPENDSPQPLKEAIEQTQTLLKAYYQLRIHDFQRRLKNMETTNWPLLHKHLESTWPETPFPPTINKAEYPDLIAFIEDNLVDR